MKITLRQLKALIREEIERTPERGPAPPAPPIVADGRAFQRIFAYEDNAWIPAYGKLAVRSITKIFPGAYESPNLPGWVKDELNRPSGDMSVSVTDHALEIDNTFDPGTSARWNGKKWTEAREGE